MDSSVNGQTMLDTLLTFFHEDHWPHQKIANKPMIRAGYHGDRGTWVCFAQVDEENDRFVFTAQAGMNIQPEYRADIMDYLMRVNYRLSVGNFEMNPDTGDVRFRVGLEAPGSYLTIDTARALINTAVKAMDRYFPGIVAIIHAGLQPEAALARAETESVSEY